MRPGQWRAIGWLRGRWTAETNWEPGDPARQRAPTLLGRARCASPGLCGGDRGAGVSQPKSRSPTDRVSFKRQDAAATRSSVLRPVGLPQPPCPAAGPAATEELPAPGAACRGGAGRERGPEA